MIPKPFKDKPAGKPRLSEIRAFQQTCHVSTMDEAFLFDNCAYLLDLVERMGEALELVLEWKDAMDANEISRKNSQRIYDASAQMIKEARELLKEIEK